jgi:hypothetical protein
MSEYIEFFAAPDDAAAAAVHARGPGPSLTTVSGTGTYIDADDAVITWENLLTCRARPNMATCEEPRMVADYVNDGSAVFALSDELVAKLTEADSLRLQEIAEAWLAEVLRDGAEIDLDAALGILLGVAELAREAARSGDRVYCWVSG